MSDRFVLRLEEINQTQVSLVGAKGAQLGELSRVEGIHVPAGFCVTTEAFRRVVASVPWISDSLDRVSRISPDNSAAIHQMSAAIRQCVEEIALPDDLVAAITHEMGQLGENAGYAVRSSATAEDLPKASFAGQHDTYLNIVGSTEIMHHVSRCWASLFTERAVTYRLRNGCDNRKVQMAVVVQQTIFSQVAGALFTADPETSNRKLTCVEASFGLGEGIVGGLVNADLYKVRNGDVVVKKVADKQRAIYASPAGGTQEVAIEPERQGQEALTDAQVLLLAQLGRRIEAHFGQPQDIEWCLAEDEFHVVQSRPITTLFPVPAASDRKNHVYVSVGHQQMMTDAMKPLGLSIWQLTTPRPMYEAGGRLYVDVTQELASPVSRPILLEALGRSDPLIGDALRTVLERSDFVAEIRDETAPMPWARPTNALETDPTTVTGLIERCQESLAKLQRDIRTETGSDLLDFISADIQELTRFLVDPLSVRVIRAAMDASWWLNERVEAWLGDKNVAAPLAQSVPNNVTSNMGLDLLGVADVIRPHREVVAFLRHVEDEHFLDRLPALEGGREAKAEIEGYLDRYGVRCVGEIDITTPRWTERPTTLVPLILSNIQNFEPGAGERRFEVGEREASAREQDLLARLRALPDGEQKAIETKAMIDRLRTFTGYREYPKYHMVSRYFVYKQALLKEAERLVQAHALCDTEDMFFLRFEELREVVRTHQADEHVISQRKEAFLSYQALRPPRVITSDGEVVAGRYRRVDVPPNALVGLPVSGGTVEGRARVILNLGVADLEADDILVTVFTDPSWTPVFVTIKGLVTEVGGLMTHGAVIAREYGLPAVVGVESATRLIPDGQRIRLHGADGYIEFLS